MQESRHSVTVLLATFGIAVGLAWFGKAGDAIALQPEGAVVDTGIASYTPTAPMSGNLTVAGSDTMQPLMTKLAFEFTKLYPDVRLAIEGGGSAEAIREFVLGYSRQRRGEKSRGGHEGAAKAEILASSLQMSPEEMRAFSTTNGYEPLAISVAADAVTLYVHKDNPVPGLTLQQVDAMFGTTRKRGLSEAITTWGQSGAANGWERQPIHLYGRDRKSGTRNFFVRAVLLDGELKEDIKELPGTASEILAIARDPLGIGYAGVSIKSSYVRAVPLAEQEGKPFITPGAESVKDGSYPLHRMLYLYVNKSPNAAFSPVVEEFLKFINSREGQGMVIKAGFYPLSAKQVAQNLNTMKAAAGN
jgi:phosphate transport system substrate-binding protein